MSIYTPEDTYKMYRNYLEAVKARFKECITNAKKNPSKHEKEEYFKMTEHLYDDYKFDDRLDKNILRQILDELYKHSLMQIKEVRKELKEKNKRS